MKKQSIKMLTVTLLAWGALSAQAQMNHGSMRDQQNSVQHSGQHMLSTDEENVVSAVGVVKKIEENKMRITLEHDPIETLGWPKMVMPFNVVDHELFDGLSVGDKVTFELKNETTIIAIKKL